ncbi:MAG: chloride channel protein [Proteobacteria bacterium]|nr:chloride channel protein [Pseudomonadota bacterium]
MKKQFTEEVILFVSILKWFALATFIGAIVGVSTSIFLKALSWGTLHASEYKYYFLFLPIAFFLSVIIIKYLAPEAEGHGTEKVIEAIHKRSGKINPLVVPVKLIATVITISAGGSAGKEGPCAQIGSGLSSIFADIFRFDDSDRKKLVICGISAGFASVFGTPIAGAMFGIEVLVVGNILYDVLLPSFIAGVTAYHISSSLGITYLYHPINLIPVFSELFLIKIVLSGMFFGICSLLLIEMLKIGKNLSDRLQIWAPLKGLIGGSMLVCLALIFSKQYLGLGLETIESALEGKDIIWYAFIIKIIFTGITLNFGGSGGIVTPIFFIGATAGTLFATIFNMDIATFSAIGFVSLLAGAANTPIAASIMAVELFGPKIAPYAAVACVISFLMTGHRSVYPSQLLGVLKSSSIHVELGKEVCNLEPQFHHRGKSLIGICLKLFQRFRNKDNNCK